MPSRLSFAQALTNQLVLAAPWRPRPLADAPRKQHKEKRSTTPNNIAQKKKISKAFHRGDLWHMVKLRPADVVRWPGYAEYRIHNWRLARDGSSRVVRGTCACSWVDLVALAFVSQFERSLHVPRPLLVLGVVLAAYLIWMRFTQVLYESLLVSPIGVQLSTHRGHPLLPPIFSSHHFIPRSALADVVLHEGFRRWDVWFYLAVLKRRRVGVEVRVAFENVLPYFPVLKVVYLEVQEAFFPPHTRVVETANDP